MSTPAKVNKSVHAESCVKRRFICFHSDLAYYNQDVRFDTRNLCCHQMPVFLSGEVSCVQQLEKDKEKKRDFYLFFEQKCKRCRSPQETNRCYLDPRYFNHEHSSSQHVAGVVAPELDPCHLLHLMKVDGLDLVHALLQVSLSVQHVVS